MKKMESLTEGKRYLLVITNEDWAHDQDEWIGIYPDGTELKEAYISTEIEFNKKKEEGMYIKGQELAIFEFIPRTEMFAHIYKENKEKMLRPHGQICKRVQPEELNCFREGSEK